MRLYLIRHAESEHNVARVYAGVTDSALTNHGIIQIERLSCHLRAQGVRFTRVFSSPLQRARMTAEGLCKESDDLQPVLLPILIEKNFGSMEGQSWRSNSTSLPSEPSPHHQEPETASSVTARVKQFIDSFLFPLLQANHETEVVAVVSHGLTLLAMWDTLAALCSGDDLIFGPAPLAQPRHPGWSNTGYMELEVAQYSEKAHEDVFPGVTSQEPAASTGGLPILSDSALVSLKITVYRANERQHLHGLRRTRNGVGSAKHDPQQKRIDHFFPKPED
ncbi:hypothetical protein LOZ57_002726 [Ophidiomyces ophidiicola]|nr:uncharacterized protein LOZ57_002726 [Ophidiomyces ophidiicola]KAI1948375.1 hypothetical protein LOZ57_002726 [Ophidiomyces ophidiicola]KAI2061584.1 hypothetical protein LOZ43_000998 [Ophidiomyces ophidiicola]